jgi:transposase
MANVLHVYEEVEIVNEYRRGETGRQLGMVTISYDEKPGIQALATTTPDRPPVVGTHPSHLRDYEYVRLGAVSLLAGLDLHSGRVTETVSDTHNSSDFIAFLRKLDGAYPEHHQIRLVLDNHSAHISKETRGYLQTMPHRFVFVFTPTHGSWLNLIENQFSKMTRTMLRGIRVASKQELFDRIHQYFEEINAAPVVFRWKYKMDENDDLGSGATDASLEAVSHYATEPAAEKLEKPHPGLAARLWRAQGMRIVNAKKSKYYDAALSNFERARDCYLRAGMAAEWEQTVRKVCAAHFRKSGFIGGFQALAAGARRSEKPSFLESAKERWGGAYES